MDKNLNLYGGDFPVNIETNLIEHTQVAPNLQTICKELHIQSVNPQRTVELCNDKRTSKLVFEKCGLKTPEGISFSADELKQPDKLVEKIEAFTTLCSRNGYVIKPPCEGAGAGVTIIESDDKNRLRNLISEFIEKVSRQYGIAMVEERIRSYPYYDKDGKRLDWNIRLLACKNGIIDMEARVKPWEETELQGPGNKAKGAWIEEVRDVLNKAGIKDAEQDELVKEMYEITLKVSKELNGSFLGFDFIIDENKKLYCIEVNASPGGIQSLAEIRSTKETKLAAAERFLVLLNEQIASKRRSANKETEKFDYNFWSPMNCETLFTMIASIKRTSKKEDLHYRLELCEKIFDRFKEQFSDIDSNRIVRLLSFCYKDAGFNVDSEKIEKRLSSDK